MPQPLNLAIKTVTAELVNRELPDQQCADIIADALELIHERMGLDFTESFLNAQLEAIEVNRSNLSFLNVLGLALYRKVLYELAICCFKFRTGINSKDKVAFNNLGLSYNRMGRSVDAARAYQCALDSDPYYKQAGSNLLYLQHYIWGADANDIAQKHKQYANMHYRTVQNDMAGRKVILDPNRKLRLGFVSGDLRFHAVSRFVAGIFSTLNRKQFELFVYHTYHGIEDTISEDLKQSPLDWKRVKDTGIDDLSALIEKDQIDILFDLSVYTQGGLPDLMARQVAPIQVNYMGYPDTSGIPAMNYRISDTVSDPVGVDARYSEKLIRLPVAMWNFTPWPNLPKPAPSPYQSNGYITFGSMNNHAKLQPQWMRVWAKVLRQVPNSKLLFKSRAMGSERVLEELLALFEDNGVSRERILPRTFEPSPNDHFIAFNEIDICLDSFPYNGTTTTFDSLWMGVPVVTLQGELHVSRTSASILHAMNMDDWVADDEAHFVQICVDKASKAMPLADMRNGLRTTMQNCSLGDPELFCQHFGNALRGIWQQYCDNPPSYIVASTMQQNLDQSKADSIGFDVSGSTQPVVSIIVCASNNRQLQVSKQHLTTTVGIPHEFIGLNNEQVSLSLSAAYNAAGSIAKGQILVFIHDDVFVQQDQWGQILHRKFIDDKQLGLIGFAGTSYLQAKYPYWVASKRPFIHGSVVHHSNQIRLSNYSEDKADQRVVAIDGLMMVATAAAFSQTQFDEEFFNGFHFYDLDFSVRVSEHFKVIVTRDLLLKHFSGGKFDDTWKHYRDVFRKKYGQEKVWSCAKGTPQQDSHKKRLSCHYPLEDFFNHEDATRLTNLGSEHPKHPAFKAN